MLAIALLAAAMPSTGNAPESLNGHELHYHVSTATGVFSDYANSDSVVTYTDSSYADNTVGGGSSDRGTYDYTQLDANRARIDYHPTQGTWQGGDYSEVLQFTTSTGGMMTGTPKQGSGAYQGTFTVAK